MDEEIEVLTEEQPEPQREYRIIKKVKNDKTKKIKESFMKQKLSRAAQMDSSISSHSSTESLEKMKM